VALEWARLCLVRGRGDDIVEALRPLDIGVREWWGLGRLAERHDQAAVAAAAYGQALRHDRDNPALLNNWAWASLQAGASDRDAVLGAAERAHRALPNNAEIVDTYSEALLRFERPFDCIDLLTERLSLARKHPQLLWNLARAYELREDAVKALQAYRECRNLAAAAAQWPLRNRNDELDQRIAALERQARQR
jgi:predicted Zn-dependent protease